MKKSISVLFCAACMLCLCFLSGCTLTFGNLSSTNKVYCQLDGLSSLSFSVRPLSTREADVIAEFAACVEEAEWEETDLTRGDLKADPWDDSSLSTVTRLIFKKGFSEIGFCIDRSGTSYAVVGDTVFSTGDASLSSAVESCCHDLI